MAVTISIPGGGGCRFWGRQVLLSHIDVHHGFAGGFDNIAAATGFTSERAVQRPHALPEHALIDIGDVVCGTLRDLRTRPVARLTIAGGGFAKPAAGDLDLHSARSRIDTAALDRLAGDHPFATAEMVS